METLKDVESVIKQRPSHVGVDTGKVLDFVRSFDKNKLNHWLSISPFDLHQLNEIKKMGFLFVLNSISFSYWGTPKWTVEYHGKEYDGAQGMMACLGRAIEKGNPILDFCYLRDMPRIDLEKILDGNIKIPLLDERLRSLRELGKVIFNKYRRDPRHLIDEAETNASRLVDIILENFPSFEDYAVYRRRKIDFGKRAQLLVSDISFNFGGLDDIEKLTACADYKLPQVLRRYGILKYTNQLRRKIEERKEIPHGSEEEVEIRANTIHAVELIRREIKGLTSSQINDSLWLEGQIKLFGDEPYHLTRTTAY